MPLRILGGDMPNETAAATASPGKAEDNLHCNLSRVYAEASVEKEVKHSLRRDSQD